MKKALLVATVQSHIAQFHKPLIKILKEAGYEIHVAARDNLAEKNGLQIENIDKKYDVEFRRSPFDLKNLQAYHELKGIIDKKDYDIISCNTPVGGLLTRIAARKSRKNKTKVFYTAHGFHFYHGAPKKNWLLYYPIEKCMSRLTDVLITITKEDFQLATKRFHTTIERIPGVGVDEKRYYPVSAKEKAKIRTELGYGLEQKIILCIGELLPNKNQTMAIRMMQSITKKYPETVLLLAGNGPEKENIEKTINNLALQDHVKLLGYCTCLEKYQQIADVFVSCSKREGLPLNIVEAMLSANAVIATKNRGHLELITHGENGYLVDVDDVNAMIEYVELLLNNKELNAEIGTRAQISARQYGYKVVESELRNIYLT